MATQKQADEVFTLVCDATVDVLRVKPEEISMEANFVDDLRADSLDLVELILKLEETVQEKYVLSGKDFEISDEEAEAIRTVSAAVDFICERVFPDSSN